MKIEVFKSNYDEQSWALEHARQIRTIAIAVCQVNAHAGKTPCSSCVKSANEFFVSATFKKPR